MLHSNSVVRGAHREWQVKRTCLAHRLSFWPRQQLIDTRLTTTLLLEVVLSACVQGGNSKSSLLGTSTGMFLGICNMSDWQQLQRDNATEVGTFGAHGSDGGAAAGRVSYLLGLKGPCFSVNTACSSSLVALDAAHQNLRLHACEHSSSS